VREVWRCTIPQKIRIHFVSSFHVRVALVAALVSIGCHREQPSTPTQPTSFLTVSLLPSEGDLLWEPAPADSGAWLTPALSWEASFVAPTTTWRLHVAVDLIGQDETSICCQSTTLVEVQEGGIYRVGGVDYRLVSWPENPCGTDFTVETVEVTLRDGYPPAGNLLEKRRFPCRFRVTRRR